MSGQRHHLVERLAQAQLAQRSSEEVEAQRVIDAQHAFRHLRLLAESHSRGRRLLAWAQQHGHLYESCFVELAKGIAANLYVAFLLMDCWCDHPECQEVA
jgi:hypothetical protein